MGQSFARKNLSYQKKTANVCITVVVITTATVTKFTKVVRTTTAANAVVVKQLAIAKRSITATKTELVDKSCNCLTLINCFGESLTWVNPKVDFTYSTTYHRLDELRVASKRDLGLSKLINESRSCQSYELRSRLYLLC